MSDPVLLYQGQEELRLEGGHEDHGAVRIKAEYHRTKPVAVIKRQQHQYSVVVSCIQVLGCPTFCKSYMNYKIKSLTMFSNERLALCLFE